MQEESGKMTAQEYLGQVERKERVIKNLERSRENLQEMMYSLGGSGSGERVQTSRDTDKFGTLYGRIDEKEREIADEFEKLIDLKLKVSGEISGLKDIRYVELLHKKYILLEPLKQISMEMNYTYRYATKLHGNALQAFEQEVLKTK